jgi:hypothetical protein
MKIYAPVFLALATGSVALWGIASAQTPPPAFVPCTRMSDPAERLGCYDRQMAAMGAVVATSPPASPGTPPKAPIPAQAVASITAPPPPAAVPPVAAPPATSEARFGAEDIRQTERPKHSKEEKVLLSTITSIRQVRPKLFMIVLANGQIWMQDGTQITAFFRAGYEARIERGLLGDYRMSTAQTGEKNMVRVTRLQ